MKLATPEQMRSMDHRAIHELGVPGIVLMENAGAAVAREAETLCRLSGCRRVHVVCGTGNNGGDGLVAARQLLSRGMPVSVRVVGDAERMRGDAATNLGLARTLGMPFEDRIPSDAVVVDALLGTGTQGPARGPIAEAIEAVNASGRPVVAIDVPSGIHGSTGAVPGAAIRASITVTLGFAKPGLLLYPAAEYVGRVVVDTIGMCWDSTGVPLPLRWFDEAEARATLPARPPAAHKGAFGHVLVIGGSSGMTGAPVLAARGALRGGSGLVTIAVPSSIRDAVATHVQEAMFVPLPDTDGHLAARCLDALAGALERATVVCLGPGLGRAPETFDFVRRLVAVCPHPLVLDADGLMAVAGMPDLVRGRAAPTVLTPHPGEAARLLATAVDSIQDDRVGAARELAFTYRAVAILKGARTVVSNGLGAEGEQTDALPASIITVGNAGMATGGSGDVLTGLVGALIAQEGEPYGAACLAAYVHGRAGDLAAARTGQVSLVAGDIAEALAEAFKELVQ